MELNQNLFENIQKYFVANILLQEKKDKLEIEQNLIEEEINSNLRTIEYLHKSLMGQKGYLGTKDLPNSGNIITNKITSNVGHLYIKGREGNSFSFELLNPKKNFLEMTQDYKKIISFLNNSQKQYTKEMKTILPWNNGYYTLDKIELYIPLNREHTEWEMHSHTYMVPLEMIYDGASFHMERY